MTWMTPFDCLTSAVVTVATPLQREVTEWDDFIGRFEASRSVEVRPRVSGQIVAVHFRDGQFVHRGQPLFTIDARPYRAELAEAQAGVATAHAQEAAPAIEGDIVVTAQKREERLQDVPLAVTALSADNLATRQIYDNLGLSDAAR